MTTLIVCIISAAVGLLIWRAINPLDEKGNILGSGVPTKPPPPTPVKETSPHFDCEIITVNVGQTDKLAREQVGPLTTFPSDVRIEPNQTTVFFQLHIINKGSPSIIRNWKLTAIAPGGFQFC